MHKPCKTLACDSIWPGSNYADAALGVRPCVARAGGSELHAVTQLNKVLARVWVLDTCVRDMLYAQLDFVLALIAKHPPGADVGGEVKPRAKDFASHRITVVRHSGAHTRVQKEARTARVGHKAETGRDFKYRGGHTTVCAVAVAGPAAKRQIPVA